MRAAAILLAAGRGERLGGERPKALLEVGGTSLLRRAVRTVDAVPEIEGFVVMVPRGLEETAKAQAASSPRFLAAVEGGDSRRASVRRGLNALPDGFDVVVCHDVARPLAAPGLFTAVLRGLEGADGAVPAVPVTDTVKRVGGGWVIETVPRHDLALAQTPQAFRRVALEEAHRAAEAEGLSVTDDAALMERAGRRIAVVPGDAGNVKVTTPEDLERVEAIARIREGS
ncbi:MAG TPA: 2-C-methyl-D-erythritol 4-phosphate cytidylyltransferase [Actinomycetota bacterium]